MAPQQSSQTEPNTVSPVQSSTSPSTQPREPSPLIHPPQQPTASDANAVHQPYGLYAQSYGSHYVPYNQTAPQQLRQMQEQQQQQQQQQNAQQPVTYLAVPPPFQHPPQSTRRKISKDVLHALVMVISIIGMGFAFSLLAKAMDRVYSSSYSYYEDSSVDNFLPAVSAGPVFAAACLWSLVELIVRCSRNWKAGIHPGAHVGVCLFLWLGAVIVGALLAVFVTQPWYYESCSSRSSSSSSSRNSYSSCSRYTNNPRFVGSMVLALLLAAVEFAIFVIACTETHVRNRWKRNVVIASTPYWAPPPQGWYVGPGQQQQFVPMGQSPVGHAPMTQVHPMMANAHTAPAPGETQPAAAELGGDGKGPAQPENTVREFYTPGTAQ